MTAFTCDISDFLRQNGFDCVAQLRGGMTVLWVEVPAGTEDDPSVGTEDDPSAGTATSRCIVPWPIVANTPEEAGEQAERMTELLEDLARQGHKPIIITEDRWRSQQKMMQARLLAHLERFIPMYARNCEVRKIDKETAAEFLNENHSYGDAACRYRYGLYLKRYTGKRGEGGVAPGTLVAVATFSNARKWRKGEKTIKSYEWTRYASLPGVRINGGMGKVLKAFIKEVQPDDIMSYADLEWSEGAVYEQLGFMLEDHKAPVLFSIDSRWHRSALKHQSMAAVDMPLPVREWRSVAETGGNGSHSHATCLYLQNLGSNKYRLKLTEYE